MSSMTIFAQAALVLAQDAPAAGAGPTAGQGAVLGISTVMFFFIVCAWGIRKPGNDFAFGVACVILGVTAGASGGIISRMATQSADAVMTVMGAVATAISGIL